MDVEVSTNEGAQENTGASSSLFDLGAPTEGSHIQEEGHSPEIVGGPEETSESEEPTERPEWLPEKFKSPEAMAEAYANLEGRFGGFTGAPEGDYEISVPEGFEEFSFYEGTEHDIKAFGGMAKELGMSQEAFNKVTEFYVKSEAQRAGMEHQAREAQAIEIFGGEKEAPQRIATLTAKASSQFSADEFSVLKDAASGSPSAAASAMRFAEMMLDRQSGSTPVDAGGFRSTPTGRSGAELREALVSDKYRNDAQFRAGVDSEWTQALKDGRLKR